VVTLSSSIGTVKSLMTASKERLSLCPGVGAKKVQRLFEAFNQPFLVRKKQRTDDLSTEANNEDTGLTEQQKL
jgi:ERCC4-type nuclease